MFHKCCTVTKCCADIIIFILTSLLLFIAGVIVGAYTGLAALLGLGAIIAITAILIILLIIRIITLICCKDRKQEYCCCDNDKYC